MLGILDWIFIGNVMQLSFLYPYQSFETKANSGDYTTNTNANVSVTCNVNDFSVEILVSWCQNVTWRDEKGGLLKSQQSLDCKVYFTLVVLQLIILLESDSLCNKG